MSLGANLLSIFVPSYFLTVLANVPRSKEGGEGRCRGQFSSAKYGI